MVYFPNACKEPDPNMNLNQSIALIDSRELCITSDKAMHAETAGAIGSVIMCLSPKETHTMRTGHVQISFEKLENSYFSTSFRFDVVHNWLQGIVSVDVSDPGNVS